MWHTVQLRLVSLCAETPQIPWKIHMAFKKRPQRPPGDGWRQVFSKTIRLKNGRILKAEDYGLTAFCFWVKVAA